MSRSHHHIDHTGNPTGFPETTDLIVGPGFKETQMPGYPTNEHGLVPERDYQGRNLRQLNFDTESSGADIGGFRAIDYFGDASFYLLETPGVSLLIPIECCKQSPTKPRSTQLTIFRPWRERVSRRQRTSLWAAILDSIQAPGDPMGTRLSQRK